MTKRLLVSLLALFLLVACSAEEQAAVTEPSVQEAEPQPSETVFTEETPTEVIPTEAAVSEPGSGVSASTGKMECTLVSDQPDTPAEFVEIFSVKEDDWVVGPETAAVTFVEYGDFQ